MFFKVLMRNNEGGNEKQEIYLVWPHLELLRYGQNCQQTLTKVKRSMIYLENT